MTIDRQRTVLTGRPVEDRPGFEEHFLPGMKQPTYARPGTLFEEVEKLFEGRAIRRRYLRVTDDGEERVLYEEATPV